VLAVLGVFLLPGRTLVTRGNRRLAELHCPRLWCWQHLHDGEVDRRVTVLARPGSTADLR